MTIDAGLKPEGAPERSPIAGAGAPSGVDAGAKRYSVQRKMAVVARLLRGEPLDVVAREANVSVAKLTEWRDRALAGATSALVARQSGWEGGDSQDGHFGGRGGGDDCRGATITQALFGMRADCRGATIRTIP